jgi:PAS domain S-box-containing protein
MILVIASVDWRTSPYLALGFLYVLPIVLSAGFLPRWATVLLGLGCAVLAEAFGLADRSFVRLVLEAVALSGCGLFVAELCRNRQLTLKVQERFRALVETSPAAIITVNDRGVVELANRAADALMLPSEGHLSGQPIAAFVPELQHAFRREEESQFRASMHCQVHRGNGENCAAEVWFSTYHEGGVPKLAAIIADVSEQRSVAVQSDSTPPEGIERLALNGREVAILRLVFEGLPNREIASRLEMTGSAAKHTLERLFSKTGAHSRSQLVRVALERYRDLL